MEKNIFEGAKFGDKFLTRDNHIAIYHIFDGHKHRLIINNHNVNQPFCTDDGKHHNGFNKEESPLDIVSRYQET